jgi:hypothetical protein
MATRRPTSMMHTQQDLRHYQSFRLFRTNKRFCVFPIRGIVPVGECLAQTNARDRRISFCRLCLTEFYQHNPSDFCTVVSDPEHPARHHATAQTALGGEHFCCRNLRFKDRPRNSSSTRIRSFAGNKRNSQLRLWAHFVRNEFDQRELHPFRHTISDRIAVCR